MRFINWKRIAKFACQRLAAQQDAPIDRFYTLRELAQTLRPDYRFKWPEMDWWHDEPFSRYLASFDELGGMNSDRRWMLNELLRLVDTVEGDTAECGVYRGASSFLILQANGRSNTDRNKIHHMFDSFSGLSSPDESDGNHWSPGDLACGLPAVQQELSQFENAAYYPGWIPTRFADVESRTFAFVHIDVDLYQPTRDSIQFFYPRLADQGILLCDDYGFASCPGATKAIDEFLLDKPESMVRMSGGSGFFIKGLPVGSSRQNVDIVHRAVEPAA